MKTKLVCPGTYGSACGAPVTHPEKYVSGPGGWCDRCWEIILRARTTGPVTIKAR